MVSRIWEDYPAQSVTVICKPSAEACFDVNNRQRGIGLQKRTQVCLASVLRPGSRWDSGVDLTECVLGAPIVGVMMESKRS